MGLDVGDVPAQDGEGRLLPAQIVEHRVTEVALDEKKHALAPLRAHGEGAGLPFDGDHLNESRRSHVVQMAPDRPASWRAQPGLHRHRRAETCLLTADRMIARLVPSRSAARYRNTSGEIILIMWI